VVVLSAGMWALQRRFIDQLRDRTLSVRAPPRALALWRPQLRLRAPCSER